MKLDMADGYELSNERAACCYGLPVLVFDGQDYGPADVLPSGELAGSIVKTRGPHLYPDGAESALWRSFVRGPWLPAPVERSDPET